MGFFDRFGKKAGKREGGHGNHWAAIFETEDETFSAISDSVNKKELIDQRRQIDGGIVVYDSVGGRMKILTITVDNQIWTSYPYLVNGISYDVEIESVEEWSNGLEGQIQGGLGEAAISFFDTGYLEGKKTYQDEQRYRFSLSALAYTLEVVEHEEAKEGEIGIAKGFAGFFPAGPEGDIGDFTFSSAVKEVVDFDFWGKKFFRIKASLFTMSEIGEDGEVDIYVYVPHRAIQGSKPRIGDDVFGAIWMQGHLE